jgi:hypothetical protein
MKILLGMITIALAVDQTNLLGSMEWVAGAIFVLTGYALVYSHVRRHPHGPAPAPIVHQSAGPTEAVADG